MQRRFFVLACFVSASACAAIATACGGSESSDLDGGGDATTADAPDDATPTTDAAAPDVANDVTPGNDAGVDSGCNKTANCRMCCAGEYPDAAAFFAASEESCACTTPGDCKTECASSLCNGKQPQNNSPCAACLTNKDAGACRETATAACANDVACQKFIGCVATCANSVADAGGD